MSIHVELPKDRIAEFCRRRRIAKLSLFGSVLRDDFGPDSGIDVLVEFEAGRIPTYFDLFDMERELSALLGGRRIDMRRPQGLASEWKDEVLAQATTVYVAPG